MPTARSTNCSISLSQSPNADRAAKSQLLGRELRGVNNFRMESDRRRDRQQNENHHNDDLSNQEGRLGPLGGEHVERSHLHEELRHQNEYVEVKSDRSGDRIGLAPSPGEMF